MSDGPWDCIHVIGIDDSGLDGLAEAERRIVHQADLICGGLRHLALAGPCDADRLVIRSDLEAVCDELEEACGRRRAVVLASGDPCFFGIGPLLVKRLGASAVRIHPHPSSIAAAFARLGQSWEDATVLSAHGRPIEAAVPAALAAGKIAFLTDPEHTPAAIARALLHAGMEDCDAFVCERLGGPSERVAATRLRRLPEQAYDPLNVLILLRQPPVRPARALGRPDHLYAQGRGQITKAEVRAIAVARLEPWTATVLWDIGAGSGSVAIEAAGIMSGGAVYAIEHDAEQIEILRTNLDRFSVSNVRIVEGTAPDALASLPRPDAIFIGGGGDGLAGIIRAVALQLRPGGPLVANFAILEHLQIWQQEMRVAGWPSEIAQIAVSRGRPLGDGTRLAPLGPVFVCSATRPAES